MFPGLGAYPEQPSAAAPAPQKQEQSGPVDPRYREAISLLEELLQDEPDDQDSHDLAGIIQGLYKIASDRQKEQDGMLAGKISPRALRRT